MTRFMLVGSSALVLIGLSTPATAQTSAQATGSVSIIQPIAITNSTGLQFGAVVPHTSSAGTVSINATTGARTVVTAAGVSSTTGRATFAVTGDASRAFTATVPGNFVLTSGVPADDLTVTLSDDTPASLDGSGMATIGVGGSFSLPANHPTGAYSGTFNVTVAYN